MGWKPKQWAGEAADNVKTTSKELPGRAADVVKDPGDKKKQESLAGGFFDPAGKASGDLKGVGSGGGGTPGVVAMPPQTDPLLVEGPIFDPGMYAFGAQQVIAPTSFTGAQIRPVSDPRQTLIDPTQQAQFRAQQQGLISQLSNQAQGIGPSVAGTQLQHAQQANQAAAFAQLASARGQGNPALARQAMMTSGNLQAQTSRDAAVARLQEQQQAQQLLGGTLNQARNQDISMAQSQAQLNQETELARYKGQLELAVQQGQLDQQTASLMFEQANMNSRQNAQAGNAMQQQYNDIRLKYIQMGMDAQQANQAAALAVSGANQQAALQNYQAAVQAAATKRAQQAQIYGAAATAAGAVATVYGGPATGAAVKTAGDQAAQQQAASSNPDPVMETQPTQGSNAMVAGDGR